MRKYTFTTVIAFTILFSSITNPVLAKTSVPSDVKVTANKWVVKNPSIPTVLINKNRNLPVNYKPKSLVYGNTSIIKYTSPGKTEKNKMSKVAKVAP